jgi:hypothetical protein
MRDVLDLIEQATMREPSLYTIIGEACAANQLARYNRIETYIELRNRADRFVGWYARDKSLATTEHYDAIIGLINALLPPDEVDKS